MLSEMCKVRRSCTGTWSSARSSSSGDRVKKGPKTGGRDSVCGRKRFERMSLSRAHLNLAGHTPVPQHHFNSKILTVMADRTFVNFYLRLCGGPIKAAQVVTFLAHLQRHLSRMSILARDCLPGHRSWPVQGLLSLQRRLYQEWLPAYAPELNSVEYL